MQLLGQTPVLDLSKMAAVGNLLLRGRLSSDTQDRVNIGADGAMSWGPGNAVADATLARVTGGLSLTGTFAVSAATSALTSTVTGLTGAQTAGGRRVGATSGAAPTTGTFVTGDWVIDVTGTMWICTAGGTPGTWVKPAGAVSSVFTRTGAVVAASGDYTAAQVTNAADKSSASVQTFTADLSTPNVIETGQTGTTINTNYTALTTDSLVYANGTLTVTLPPAALGQKVTVKNIGTGTVTIVGQSASTIDGQSSLVTTTQYKAFTLVSGGTNWFVARAYDPRTNTSVSELSTDNLWHEQVLYPLQTGSFTAVSNTATISISIAAGSVGNAQGAFEFMVGSSATPLFNFAGNPNGGVQHFWLPAIWTDNGNGSVSRRIVVTGLTAGTLYNWQILWGPVGTAYDAGPLASQPYGIGLRTGNTKTYTITTVGYANGVVTATVASTVGLAVGMTINITGITAFTTNNPNGSWQISKIVNATDFTYVPAQAPTPTGTFFGATAPFTVAQADKGWIADFGAAVGTPQIFPVLLGGRGFGNVGGTSQSGNFQPYGPQIGLGITASLPNPSGVAITPDGTKVVVTSYDALSGGIAMVVVDAEANTIISSFTNTTISGASGTAVGGLSLCVDATYAYLGDYANAKIWKVNIATGAATVLAVASNPFELRLTPDGTKVITGLGNGTAVIVNTNSGSAAAPTLNTTVNLVGQNPTGTGAVTSATLVRGCCIQPNGVYAWVNGISGTRDGLYRITIATGAITGYDTLQMAGCTQAAIDPTGHTMWFVAPGNLVSVGTKCSQNWTSQTGIPTGFDGQQYTTANFQSSGIWDAGQIAIGNLGDIYMPTYTNGHLWSWPSSILTCYAAADVQIPNFCTVLVEGAA